MENFNNNLNNQGGGMNNMPQNRGYQNPTSPQSYIPSAPTGGYQNPTPTTGGYQNPTPPKKSGNKKPIILVSAIVAVIAVAVVAVVLFTTGDNNDTPTSQSTTEPITETTLPATTQAEVTTQEPTAESTEATTVAEPEGGWAKADISEIAKNIEIDGKKISLPCTVGEMANMLGEEWELLYSEEVLKNNATTECKFIKGTEHILGFNLKEYNPNIPFEDHIIDSFTIFTDAFSSVSLNWINKNTTLEEIESRYGRLHSVNNNMDKNPDVHNILRLYDINSESEVIILDYFKGSLYSITI